MTSLNFLSTVTTTGHKNEFRYTSRNKNVASIKIRVLSFNSRSQRYSFYSFFWVKIPHPSHKAPLHLSVQINTRDRVRANHRVEVTFSQHYRRKTILVSNVTMTEAQIQDLKLMHHQTHSVYCFKFVWTRSLEALS